MCCRRKNSPKIRHLGTIEQLCRAASSQLRHISTIGKKVLNSNNSSTCSHNMVNFDPALTAEIGLPVWVTPANINGFSVLASLLHRRRSRDVNQILHHVQVSWAGTLYTHFRGLLPPNGILAGAKFTLRPSLALFYIYILVQRYCTTIEPWAWAKLCGVVQGMELRNFYRRRTAPPLFGRAAITLGISPHSSFLYYSVLSLSDNAVILFTAIVLYLPTTVLAY